jgi:hypothetical protein
VISKDSNVPDVLAHFPGTRRVFDAYGLHGCGGPQGPPETVEFFARVHGVPLERLLADLRAAREAPAAPYVEDLGDILHRRFFRAGIVVLLTAGVSLGTLMLAVHALRHTFTALDLFGYVQAHANAQIHGWVGLFVMGFAVQGLPRFKYVHLWKPALANGSFVLMLAGLALRTVAGLPTPGAFVLGIAGGTLQALSVLLFVVVLGKTLYRRPTVETWDKYVVTGLGCFLAAAALEPILYAFVFSAAAPDIFVGRVADVLKPFRDLQLLGFAGFLILGVSQRILPKAFGFREIGALASNAAFALLLGGLLLDVVAWGAFRYTHRTFWAIGSWIGTGLYAAGALHVAARLRAWTGGSADDRSTKFIRASYVWLAVACLMAVAEPLYARALDLRFSHAYHGAVRHAFTVGFLSLMIVGVSSKVVPILQGVDPKTLPALTVSFLLINAGNALRVLSQVLTELAPGPAFPAMVAGGMLAGFGLALWGIHLWKLLGVRPEPSAPPKNVVGPETKVADLAEACPATLDVFDRFGFRELRNPFLRRTIARRVTVRTACALKNVDEERLLRALREAAEKGA